MRYKYLTIAIYVVAKKNNSNKKNIQNKHQLKKLKISVLRFRTSRKHQIVYSSDIAIK